MGERKKKKLTKPRPVASADRVPLHQRIKVHRQYFRHIILVTLENWRNFQHYFRAQLASFLKAYLKLVQ